MNDYRLLIEQAKAFAEDSTWDITLYANISALLFESLKNLNWAGFYLMRDGELVPGKDCLHENPCRERSMWNCSKGKPDHSSR